VQLVVSRPYGYTPEATKTLWDVVALRTEASGIPVMVNVECGHTDPMITLPLGAEAELDARAKEFRLRDAPTLPQG